MNHEASNIIKSIHSDGRRHFHRKSLCDARLEFNCLSSREKIMEASLLTAMGTLGITCGFSCTTLPDKKTVRMASRGVDDRTNLFVEKKFPQLYHNCFPQLQTSVYPFHADIYIIQGDNGEWFPLNEAGIRILMGWQINSNSLGIMGLGSKIITNTYVDDEINFLFDLTDNMIFAMQEVSVRCTMQGVKRELTKANERSVDLALAVAKAETDLEQTRFSLSGFNDIFNELSGLKKSSAVVDSFLLMLLGIFSARGGYIIHVEEIAKKAHITCRSLEVLKGRDQTVEQVRTGVCRIFASTRALHMEPMQAAVLSARQMECFKPFLPETPIGLVFRVDETAMGVIGLDQRITLTPYGAVERDLLSAFTKNFLIFLKNSISFETIKRLSENQEKKNIELEKNIKALSANRRYIHKLEKTGDRIKAAIKNTMAQSSNASVRDILLILIAGMVLGLVYNYASPGGINVIPRIWLRESTLHVDLDQARQMFKNQQALFIDARPKEFYDQGHITGSENLPPSLFGFIYMMRFSQLDLDRPIVVYGRNISRRYDEETAFRLLERGHENVMVFSGDMETWGKIAMESEP